MYLSSTKGSLLHRLNVFFYSKPGAGKTEAGLSFPGLVIVDAGESGYLNAEDKRWAAVPVINVRSDQDLWYVVERTEEAIKEVVHPGFPDYKAETFMFENARMFQEMLLGDPSRPARGVKDEPDYVGPRDGSGIMGLDNARDNPDIPGIKDFMYLERMTRGFFRKVKEMPYHTIITAHAVLEKDEETSKKGLKIKDSEKVFIGVPDIISKLKYSGHGLADFFLLLYRLRTAGKLTYHASSQPYGRFDARVKIQRVMPATFDWTDKSMFNTLMGYYNQFRGGK